MRAPAAINYLERFHEVFGDALRAVVERARCRSEVISRCAICAMLSLGGTNKPSNSSTVCSACAMRTMNSRLPCPWLSTRRTEDNELCVISANCCWLKFLAKRHCLICAPMLAQMEVEDNNLKVFMRTIIS